jgi:hypothetical protein
MFGLVFVYFPFDWWSLYFVISQLMQVMLQNLKSRQIRNLIFVSTVHGTVSAWSESLMYVMHVMRFYPVMGSLTPLTRILTL